MVQIKFQRGGNEMDPRTALLVSVELVVIGEVLIVILSLANILKIRVEGGTVAQVAFITALLAIIFGVGIFLILLATNYNALARIVSCLFER